MRVARGVGLILSHALQAAKPHLYPRLTLTGEKPSLGAPLSVAAASRCAATTWLPAKLLLAYCSDGLIT